MSKQEHSVRERVTEALGTYPEGANVRVIAARSGAAESTVRQELSLLVEQGLAARVKSGSWWIYRLAGTTGRREPSEPPCAYCAAFYRRDTDKACPVHPQSSFYWRDRRPVSMDNLGHTEQNAIRFLLDLFRASGWKDTCRCALAIVRKLRSEDPHGLAPHAISALVPQQFLLENRLTRLRFEQELNAGLQK